jgi:hypothetical protein
MLERFVYPPAVAFITVRRVALSVPESDIV